MTAALSEQAAVTQWPLRLLLVGLMVAVIALLLLALRAGWVRRGRRQQLELPRPPGVEQALAREPGVTGKYLGTITAGNALDRVVSAGGVARAQVKVGPAGVLVEREGGASLVIPAGAVTDVTTTPGLLQRYYGRHGVLLVTWDWGGRAVSSGVWFTAADDQALVRERIEALIGSAVGPAGGEQP